MRIGIAADHGGFELKEELSARLRAAGYTLIDFGADKYDPDDDYPDFVVPLADAVATGWADRGIALCGSGVGASICANKILGAKAAHVSDHFSARQGVEDDQMNILCMGGRIAGVELAWDLVRTFLEAQNSHSPPHLRRLGKVAFLEEWHTAPHYGSSTFDGPAAV